MNLGHDQSLGGEVWLVMGDRKPYPSDVTGAADVTYWVLCRRHWRNGNAGPE